MSIIRPVPWTQQPQGQPQINWSNPICQGLVGLLWTGHGKPRDLLDPTLALTNTATLRPTAQGVGYGTDVAGKGVYSARATYGRWKITTPSLTCVYLGTAQAHTATAGLAGVLGGGYQTSTLYATGTAAVQANVDSVNRIASSPNPWKNPSSIATRGLVITPTTLIGYDHGITFGNTTFATATAITHEPTYARLALGSDGSDYINPPITGLWMAGWSRSLSPAEMLSLQERPWQLFAPINRRIWVPQSGAAPAFLGAWARGSTTLVGSGLPGG